MTRMYCIGDIQGCRAELDALLAHIGYSPSRHTLYVLGDMVNRGPDSAGVLRRLMALEGSAHCLLGNHDIHLLAVSQGIRRASRKDTLSPLLHAPDAPTLLHWLRQQPLALHSHGCLMVHAGVQPDWSVADTLACADDIHQHLCAPDWPQFLAQIFGNTPARWHPHLHGVERWRVIINTLTRIRFISADTTMDFAHKRGLDEAPPTLMPWYAHPQRRTAHTLVAFGHWSALGLLRHPHLLGLDSGCVWGGQLTAAEILPDGTPGAIIQTPSTTAADPTGDA